MTTTCASAADRVAKTSAQAAQTTSSSPKSRLLSRRAKPRTTACREDCHSLLWSVEPRHAIRKCLIVASIALDDDFNAYSAPWTLECIPAALRRSLQCARDAELCVTWVG
mmetsp:Transcript_21914/g.65551  ORF Transcript_21914/g.65551 Transcript_21914/m.65551 type:complete len:110 (-) Transcript_21914:12-341(-)